jgi:cytochrome c oxidase subunit 3
LSSLSETAHPPEGVHPAFVHHFESLADQKEAATLGMWLFLATEVMFFGGFFLAYTIYRNMFFHAFVQSSRHLNLTLGAANTAVLICGSLTMAGACTPPPSAGAARPWPGSSPPFCWARCSSGSRWSSTGTSSTITSCRGGIRGRGACPLAGDGARQAQVFFALYFGMTGLHALHMIIGIPLILAIAWLAHRGGATRAYHPRWR